MQKRLITLLGCATFLLSACGSVKNENAIRSMMNYENDVIELKAETIEYMINEKFSFTLLMYTEQCTYCTKAKENLSKLKSQEGYAIYKIEMYTASITYLSEKLPDYYSAHDSYPYLYIINKGQISYKSKVEDLTNYTNLKKMIKSYSIDTNIVNLTSLDYFTTYKKDHSEFLLYTYDSSQKDELNIYSGYLYLKAIETSKNLLIIDKMTAKSDLISKIYEEQGDGFDILSTYSSGQRKTTLRYGSASGLEISNFIDSYF